MKLLRPQMLLLTVWALGIVAITSTAAAQADGQAQAARAASPARPNIVLFLVDDMGVMDTSLPFLTDAQGQPRRYPLNEFYRTPHMERLAAQGVRFSQFYAMSVCSPTRVSIMTGQNAARHRTTNWINPDRNNAGPSGPANWNWQGLTSRDVTLARLLQGCGYRTIHVGKGHFGHREAEGADPTKLGFDVNIGGASIGAPGSYYGRENFGHGTRRARAAVPHLEKYHGQDIYLTEALTLEAAAAVRDAVQGGQPFFLYFPHYAVHAPFQADPRFAAHYAKSDKPEAAKAFASMIEGMDQSLGDLLDQLQQLGVAENTLVLFLGDNGSDAPLGHQHEVACAAPLRGKKGAHYEGGMRVPFIAAWAKVDAANRWQRQLPIKPGAIQTQVASVCDILPTLLPLVGAQVPQNHVIDGRRLDTLLTGKADSGREPTFLMHYPHAPHRSDYWTSYRDGDWKVIYHYFPSEASEGSHYQLFNLADDPFEQKNLAGSEPERLAAMMQKLAAQLEAHNALYPVDSSGDGDRGGVPLKPQLPPGRS